MSRLNPSWIVFVTICLSALTPIQAQGVFDIQAHRGGRGELQPENSLPAFEHAIDVGVNTLEFDIRVTHDGELVVVHDARLSSDWSNDEPLSGIVKPKVADLTLEKLQLYHQRVRFPDSKLKIEHSAMLSLGETVDVTVPTLKAVFEFLKKYAESTVKTDQQRERARTVRFCIEMKEAGFEKKLNELLTQHNVVDRTIVQSFNYDSIGRIKDINPKIVTMALSSLPASVEHIAENSKANYWGPHILSLRQSQVQDAHERGLLIVPWTVNSTSDLDRLRNWGCDGVMTDFPSLFIIHLQQLTEKDRKDGRAKD